LERVVSSIDWSPGRVRVSAHAPGGVTEILGAKAAIITVPVSLLHADAIGKGALRFAPEVPSIRRAAALVAMGQVRRVVLLLDRPLVEILDERRQQQLVRLSFLHAPGATIPVWWNSHPLRSGQLVGWAGGPAAIALESSTKDLVGRAVGSLADTMGLTRRTIAHHLIKGFAHDWTGDPFSRGAYSYSLVGGSDAGKPLSRPVRGTLFFAGEVANADGRTGTVHSAIASGYRAARQVLRELGR
jgi:monoamine oxidase